MHNRLFDNRTFSAPSTLQYFQYQTKNYDKDMSDETKTAVVYTPYGYTPDKQYDILYLMHGYGGDID